MIRCLLFLGSRAHRILSLIRESNNIKYDIFQVKKRELSLVDHIKNLKKIERKVRKKEYDIIIADNTGMFALQLAFLGKYKSIPTLLRLRGDCWTEYPDLIDESISRGNIKSIIVDKMEWQFTKAGLKFTDAFLPVSRYLKEKIEDVYGEKKPSYVLQTYVKEEFLESYEKDIDISERKYLLTITNCNFPRKVQGILDNIEQIKRILKTNEDLSLLIVTIGDGHEEFKKNFIEEMDGDVGKIEFKHNVSDMRAIYDRSLLLLHLSYLDAFPTVVIEAQAIGVPVIATSCCGMIEQIEDGITGFLFPIDDDNLLFEKTQRLIQDRDLYLRIRRKAHDFCERTYSRDTRSRILKGAIMETIQMFEDERS